MNPAICNAIIGKTEKQAREILKQFNCKWRVIVRDGKTLDDITNDRDDKRYNLVIKGRIVERVLHG